MALEIKQVLRQSQKLLLSPHMQQSLHILQLATVELRTLVTQELEDNPMLDEMTGEESDPEAAAQEEALPPEVQDLIDEEDEWREYISQQDTEEGKAKRSYRETLITKPPSLKEELLRQISLHLPDEKSKKIGEWIFGNLDESGYLDSPPKEIAKTLSVTEEEVQKVLMAIQRLDPPGIAARSLRESLLIQLEVAGEKGTVSFRVVEKYLEPLGKKHYPQIAKSLGIPVQKVKEAHERIGRLNPRPGRSLREEEAVYTVPDLVIAQKENRYELTLVNEGFPSIRINPLYKKLLQEKNSPKETRAFLREKLKRAVSLIQCLNQRKETVAKVAQVILEFQKEFLEKGPEYLKPLSLREVSSFIGCHESTVSRVVMNKTVETPHGCFPLKSFFGRPTKIETGTAAHAPKSVRALLRRCVAEEDPKHPLSDQELVGRLKKEEVTVARRTVTKYREALKILPSYLRRK